MSEEEIVKTESTTATPDDVSRDSQVSETTPADKQRPKVINRRPTDELKV